MMFLEVAITVSIVALQLVDNKDGNGATSVRDLRMRRVRIWGSAKRVATMIMEAAATMLLL
jgi:hypothetical protein